LIPKKIENNGGVGKPLKDQVKILKRRKPRALDEEEGRGEPKG